MAIKKINLNYITVFNRLELNVSSGINIIIGENGTGKTHLLKMISFDYNEKKDDILENKFVRQFAYD